MPDAMRLQLLIEGDSSAAEASIDRLSQKVGGFGSAIKDTIATTLEFGTAILGLEALGSVFDIVKSGFIDMNAQIQQAQIAFSNLTGSATEAEGFIFELQNFATKTPFLFQNLLDASRRLMAMGIDVNNVIPILQDVGNVLSAMGNTSVTALNQVTMALGTMNERGVVRMMEMQRIIRAGIPAWDILSQAIGKNTQETMDMVNHQKIASDVMLKAFDDYANSAKFGDVMEQQSHTFIGALTNIKDGLYNAIARGTQPFFDDITHIADAIGQFVSGQQFIAWSYAAADAMSGLLQGLGDMLSFLAPLGPAIAQAFQDLTNGQIGQALSDLGSGFSAVFSNILSTINSLGESMFGAGYNLISTLASGIYQAADEVVTAAVNYVAELIASFLVGNSPPPKGPLNKIDEGGRNTVIALADGMKSGLGAVQDAVTQIADTFNQADFSGDLDNVSAKADAAAGSMGGLKDASHDATEEIHALSAGMNELNDQANILKDQIKSIKQDYQDQLDPLQEQLTLIKDTGNAMNDQKKLALDQQELNIRMMEAQAQAGRQIQTGKNGHQSLGGVNPATQKAIDDAKAQLAIQKEQLSIQEEQERIEKEKQTIPIQQQIDAIKEKEKEQLLPLAQQLAIIQQQKHELEAQKGQWQDLKNQISDAGAGLKGAGGGKGGGGIKAPSVTLPKGTDIFKNAFDVGQIGEDLKQKAQQLGQDIANKLSVGAQEWFSQNGGKLIAGALGAILGSEFGPLGIVLGADLGVKFFDALQKAFAERGTTVVAVAQGIFQKIGDYMAQLNASIQQVGVFETLRQQILAIGGSQTLAIFDYLVKAVQNIVTTVGQAVQAFKTNGFAGIWAMLADAFSAFAPTGERIGRLLNTIQTAFSGTVGPATDNINVLKLLNDSYQLIATVTNDITGFLETIIDDIVNLTKYFQDHVVAATALVVVITGVATALGLMAAGFVAQQAAMIATTAASTGFEAAMLAVNLVLDANPIGLIVVALAALAAGFIYAYTHSETFRDTVDSVWKVVQTVVSAAVQIVINDIQAWIDIYNTVSGIIQAFPAIVATAWQTIQNTIQTTLDTVSTAIATAWNTITSLISTAMTTVQTAITTAWNAIGSFLNSILSSISNGLKNWVDSWPEDIRNDLEKIGQNLQERWQNFLDTINTKLSDISNAISTTWNTITTTISTVLETIGSVISTTWNSITTTVTTVMSGIWSVVSSGWNRIYDAVQTAVQQIYSQVQTEWNNIESEISNVLNTVLSNVESEWNDIYDAINSKLQDIIRQVKSTFEDIVQAIKDEISAAEDAARQIGQAIVDGLVNVINSAEARVTGAIADIVRAAIAAAKKALGIASPSKVFYEIGNNVIEGLIQGIQGGFVVVQSTVSDLANSVVSSMGDMYNQLLNLGQDFENQINPLNPQAAQTLQTKFDTAADQFARNAQKAANDTKASIQSLNDSIKTNTSDEAQNLVQTLTQIHDQASTQISDLLNQKIEEVNTRQQQQAFQDQQELQATAFRRAQEDAANQLQLKKDLEAAKTDAEKQAIQDRYDAQVQSLKDQRAQEDAATAFQKQQAADLQKFNDNLAEQKLEAQVKAIRDKEAADAQAAQDDAEAKGQDLITQLNTQKAALASSLQQKLSDLGSQFEQSMSQIVGDAGVNIPDFTKQVQDRVTNAVNNALQQAGVDINNAAQPTGGPPPVDPTTLAFMKSTLQMWQGLGTQQGNDVAKVIAQEIAQYIGDHKIFNLNITGSPNVQVNEQDLIAELRRMEMLAS